MHDKIRLFQQTESDDYDKIYLKKSYIDMTGDLIAGLMLSRIVYWHLPNREGDDKLQIERNGQKWLVRKYTEWKEEIRITEKQARRAVGILKDKNIIKTITAKFKGAPTVHISLNWPEFIKEYEALRADGYALEGGSTCPGGRMNNDERSVSSNTINYIQETTNNKDHTSSKFTKSDEQAIITHSRSLLTDDELSALKGSWYSTQYARIRQLKKQIPELTVDEYCEHLDTLHAGRLNGAWWNKDGVVMPYPGQVTVGRIGELEKYSATGKKNLAKKAELERLWKGE